MKTLLLLSLLLIFVSQSQIPTNEGSPLTVTSYKWARARKAVPATTVEGDSPQRAMIPQNKNFSRNARINDPQGVRDPNGDTLDGRSAAIDKSVAESRSPQADPVDGYVYRIKVQNTINKQVEAVFWEYRFSDPADPKLMSRRQFLCGVNIPGGKGKELEGFTRSAPSDVVDVKTLESANKFTETVLINRIEYADGLVWQRKDWNLTDVKDSYERALRQPWAPGMCKGL